MKIIILKEKHGNQYIEWSDDKNIQEIIAKKIISIRIKKKYWYTVDDLIEIDEAIANNKCLKYLYSRKNNEYEDFEISIVDKLH